MRACVFALSLTMFSIGCTKAAEPAPPPPPTPAAPPSLKELGASILAEFGVTEGFPVLESPAPAG